MFTCLLIHLLIGCWNDYCDRFLYVYEVAQEGRFNVARRGCAVCSLIDTYCLLHVADQLCYKKMFHFNREFERDLRVTTIQTSFCPCRTHTRTHMVCDTRRRGVDDRRQGNETSTKITKKPWSLRFILISNWIYLVILRTRNKRLSSQSSLRFNESL